MRVAATKIQRTGNLTPAAPAAQCARCRASSSSRPRAYTIPHAAHADAPKSRWPRSRNACVGRLLLRGLAAVGAAAAAGAASGFATSAAAAAAASPAAAAAAAFSLPPSPSSSPSALRLRDNGSLAGLDAAAFDDPACCCCCCLLFLLLPLFAALLLVILPNMASKRPCLMVEGWRLRYEHESVDARSVTFDVMKGI
jgi:hypothetical protein